ncbi:hypothetical protein KM043_013723 [Ampulex compressa]|nr:hypothetical protein KM043_013723 [Ampulex compressa]
MVEQLGISGAGGVGLEAPDAGSRPAAVTNLPGRPPDYCMKPPWTMGTSFPVSVHGGKSAVQAETGVMNDIACVKIRLENRVLSDTQAVRIPCRPSDNVVIIYIPPN